MPNLLREKQRTAQRGMIAVKVWKEERLEDRITYVYRLPDLEYPSQGLCNNMVCTVHN